MNKRWSQSIELSKRDFLYQDASETAAASKDPKLAESLLRFFVDQGDKECFAACLYTCYSLIKPDVVLELAWRMNLTNFAMPYMIQAIREYTTRIFDLETKLTELEKSHAEVKEKAESVADNPMLAAAAAASMNAPLALMPPPGVMPLPAYGAGAPLPMAGLPPLQPMSGFGPGPTPFGGPLPPPPAAFYQ